MTPGYRARAEGLVSLAPHHQVSVVQAVRDDDLVADSQPVDAVADLCHDADGLVAHDPRWLVCRQIGPAVDVEIRPADSGGGYPDDGVRSVLDDGYGDLCYAHGVGRSLPQDGLHRGRRIVETLGECTECHACWNKGRGVLGGEGEPHPIADRVLPQVLILFSGVFSYLQRSKTRRMEWYLTIMNWNNS